MLRFCVGKTGDGKTKFIISKILDELRFSDRPIVTNAALRLDPWVQDRKKGPGVPYIGLLRTLEKYYREDTFKARRRVHILTEKECYAFWRVRPHIPEDPEEPISVRMIPPSEDKRFHFDGSVYSQCFYVVDEGHEYFPKEEWKKLEGEGQSWASQNRRSGDDCWILTQEPGLVAKGLRDQSKECYRMVNHGHRVMFMLRQPDKITWQVFLRTPPADSEPALNRGFIEYPREVLEGCYDTNGGASVKGAGADIGYRPKGLHWSAAPIALVAGICLFMLLLSGCKHAMMSVLGGGIRMPGRPVQAIVSNAPVKLVSPVHVEGPKLPSVREPEIGTNCVQAWMKGRAGYAVSWSDGMVTSAEQVYDSGRYVFVDGIRYSRVAPVPVMNFPRK